MNWFNKKKSRRDLKGWNTLNMFSISKTSCHQRSHLRGFEKYHRKTSLVFQGIAAVAQSDCAFYSSARASMVSLYGSNLCDVRTKDCTKFLYYTQDVDAVFPWCRFNPITVSVEFSVLILIKLILTNWNEFNNNK